MERILPFCVVMLATIPVAAQLCRFRLRRNKRVSYGTVIASACIMAITLLILFSGGECFTLRFWSPEYNHDPQHMWDPEWPFSFLRLIGFITVICAFPALGVVAYYQKQGKKDDANEA